MYYHQFKEKYLITSYLSKLYVHYYYKLVIKIVLKINGNKLV